MATPSRYSLFGLLAAAFAIGILALSTHAQKPEPPKKEKEPEIPVMQRKLLLTQKILEGLAKSDFAAMQNSADDLIKCLNDVTWKINETEKYLQNSDQFRREINELKKASTKKNLEAAALAFTDMTRSCVRCHQQLRENNP